MNISRRNFLSMVFGFAGCFLLPKVDISFGSPFPQFFFAQLKYRGGEWDPNPRFVEAMVEELELRTSIDARKERRVMEITDPDVFFSPFLYMAGRYTFEPFTQREREILRRFFTYGGFLFAEDTVGAKGFGFDAAFRQEMKQILPDKILKPLPSDHAVYQSFYLINRLGGRQKVTSYLEGITIDNWTPVIYSQNDLSGAWSKDRYGNWVHECRPEGEPQRIAAFKTGINIILYSLTGDYKQDVVHHPFIKRRLNP
jgi:hypothetical protein